MRRALLFLPSLALGVLGGAWLLFVRPFPYRPSVGPALQLALGLGTGLALLLGAWALERTAPSFREATRILERALRGIRLPLWLGLLLAAATAGAEEVLFRGALLPLVGMAPQAILFGLMHPVPRRAWAYPVYAVVAGLALGALTRATGSLTAPLVAHFVVNLQGFVAAGAGARRPTPAPAARPPAAPAALPFDRSVAPRTGDAPDPHDTSQPEDKPKPTPDDTSRPPETVGPATPPEAGDALRHGDTSQPDAGTENDETHEPGREPGPPRPC